jgi:hypothetical protein
MADIQKIIAEVAAQRLAEGPTARPRSLAEKRRARHERQVARWRRRLERLRYLLLVRHTQAMAPRRTGRRRRTMRLRQP